MQPTRPEIEEAFRRVGLRRTPQRFDVMDFLLRHPVHATADQIYEELNRRDPRVSRATVYNSLRSLMEAGLVREVAMEGKAARFDAYLRRHHHFVCDRCGKVEDVDFFDLPARERDQVIGTRRVREFQVTLYGLCEACGR